MEVASKPAPPPPKDTKAADATAFSAAVLSPSFPPFPERNPFELPGAKRPALAKSDKSGSKGSTEKVATDADAASLVLNATCIVGQHRMAFINGRVYREKEAIQTESEDGVSWVVTEILPHKVLLSYQGVPLQLTYANANSTVRAASSAAGDNSRKSTK